MPSVKPIITKANNISGKEKHTKSVIKRKVRTACAALMGDHRKLTVADLLQGCICTANVSISATGQFSSAHGKIAFELNASFKVPLPCSDKP